MALKKNLIFQFKLYKSSNTPRKAIAKAKKEIYMNMSSASPSNLTDRKKLIAIPTPPNGGMFKAFNLF